MFDWEDMRTFAALARTGTLSGAAKALRVNHVTIARRVAALEDALGVQLVERLPRKTVLTKEGAGIAALAADMEGAAEAVWQAASQDGLSVVGQVTISATPALASGFLIPKLAPFCTAHPQLKVTISALPGTALLDGVDADLAIRLIRPDQPNSQVMRLGALTFSLYATPEIAATPPEDWSFIGYDLLADQTSQHRWLSDYAGSRPIAFRTTDVNGQVAAAVAGLGVALLPHFMAEGVAGIVRVDPGIVIPRRNVWLTSPHDLRRSQAVRVVAEALMEAFAASPLFNPMREAPAPLIQPEAELQPAG